MNIFTRLWRWYFNDGPSVARRPENPVDERLMQRVAEAARELPADAPSLAVIRERKRWRLRRAYRSGDLEEVRRLTREIAEMGRQ